MNERIIRALYDAETITIYQAFNKKIAESAILNQTFICPFFKIERMTWIKPSFLWMMYRSGWATKESQEYILAIKIKREGFDWALQNSCLSHFNEAVHFSYHEWKINLQNYPVRVQWDPEKDIMLNSLPYRTIQIGLSAIAVEKYLSEWIVNIENITSKCNNITKLIKENKIEAAKDLLPVERIYPLPKNIALKINSFY